jgi:hypothetical protein
MHLGVCGNRCVGGSADCRYPAVYQDDRLIRARGRTGAVNDVHMLERNAWCGQGQKFDNIRAQGCRYGGG